MYEDEVVYLEDISEEEYELVCNTFANELCGWVAYEVYKKRGQDMTQIGTYRGACFYLKLKCGKKAMVHVDPYSADHVEVSCMTLDPIISIVTPEEAVGLILQL
ncbi:MAG: hypothetical protein IJB02_00060 [Oscillospiraceae bacterium]|nr:hypothetical protein [Oscillospiraceae bacterium]